MTHNLTLEMVAEKAGVSRSTVSRVVNNHPNVRDDVRARVLGIIQETGYSPHPAARSLASHRTNVLGLVIPRSTHTFFTDPYFPALTEGVAEACNLHDYTLSLFLIKTEEDERRLLPRLSGKGFVDGLIIQATHLGDNFIPQLSRGEVPFLVAGRPVNAPEANYIDVDNVGGAYEAVVHLIQCGRKRIATVTCALNTSVGEDRYDGYKKALQTYGLPFDENLVAEGDFTEQSGYLAAKRLLLHSPEAIFAGSDTMAIGVMRAIQEAGLEIPKDVSLVGFDDLPPARQYSPQLTTIRQPIRRFGAKAVETLLDISEQVSSIPRHIILGTELIVRASSMCASQV
jgi:LacI family transcriptional regulator